MTDLEKVKQNSYALCYLENQTELICLKAVKQNGYILKFVTNKTYIKYVPQYLKQDLLDLFRRI